MILDEVGYFIKRDKNSLLTQTKLLKNRAPNNFGRNTLLISFSKKKSNASSEVLIIVYETKF